MIIKGIDNKVSPMKLRATKTAPIAPNIIWPSTPIFHILHEKVTISAKADKDIMLVITNTLLNESNPNTDPSNIAINVLHGETPSNTSSIEVQNKANPKAIKFSNESFE